MLQLPTEDDTRGHGANSVVSLVQEGSPPKVVGLIYAEDGMHHTASEKDDDDRTESLSPRNWEWWQVKEKEGELITDLEQQQHQLLPADDYSEVEELEEEGAGAKYTLGPTPAVSSRERGNVPWGNSTPNAYMGGGTYADACGRYTTQARVEGERELPTVRLLERRSEELDAGAMRTRMALQAQAPHRSARAPRARRVHLTPARPAQARAKTRRRRLAPRSHPSLRLEGCKKSRPSSGLGAPTDWFAFPFVHLPIHAIPPSIVLPLYLFQSTCSFVIALCRLSLRMFVSSSAC